MPPENKQATTPTTSPIVPVPHKPATSGVAPQGAQSISTPTPPTPLAPVSATTVPEAQVTPPTQPAPPQATGSSVASTTLEEQITQKEIEQKTLVLERIGIEEESKELFSTRKALEEKITPIELEEKLSIEHILELEKERIEASDPHDARIAETNRWAEEERRRGIEHRRFLVAEELETLNQKIHEKELTFKTLLAKESECATQIAQLRIKIQQRDLAVELEAITTERAATEADHKRFSVEYERLTTLLNETTRAEEEAHAKEEIIEQKSTGVRTLYEEQVLAAERHKLEDARKEAEQRRWAAEDAIIPATEALTVNEEHLAEIKKKEALLRAKQGKLGAS